jgi:hypothetical protein
VLPSLIFRGGDRPTVGCQVNQWQNEHEEIFARAFSDGVRRWIDWPALGLFSFSTKSFDVEIWPAAGAARDTIADIFSRVIQPIVLQAMGWQALHAAAVIMPFGVAAFCGNSGCGKSTVSYAMGCSGYRQLADDALVLKLERNAVRVCPIPFRPGLRPISQRSFAGRGHGLSGEEAEPASLNLSAVFLLSQENDVQAPCVSLLSQAEAFPKLLAHAHCFDVGDPVQSERLADDYLKIVVTTPVFTFRFRPDFEQTPLLVRAVLNALGTS